jgi:hypothetical protein
MRLSRRLCLKAPDQRFSPTLTPHRLTTASTPANALESNSAVSGFQNTSSACDGARRTIRSTRWSVARSAYTSAVPIRPEDPAIATTASDTSGVGLSL